MAFRIGWNLQKSVFCPIVICSTKIISKAFLEFSNCKCVNVTVNSKAANI